MKKEYLKPEAEMQSFQTEEDLMSLTPSTNMGVEPFGLLDEQ